MQHGKHVHRRLKLGAKGKDVRQLQESLNYLFKHYNIDWKVGTGGEYGHRTKKSALIAEWISGMSNDVRHETRHKGLSQHAQQQLRGSKNIRFGRIRRRFRRRRIRHLRHKLDAPKPGGQPGAALGTWDGRQVAGWMVGTKQGPDGRTVNWLSRIKSGGWGGDLYSGFRDPAYSESLCYGICGAPSCPGLCAGRSSNHSQTGPPNWGAIDVVDPSGFQAAANKVNAPFTNHLPADPNHRSYTGY